MFTTVVFRPFLPCGLGLQMPCRSFLAFLINESVMRLLDHPAKNMPALKKIPIDPNQLLSFQERLSVHANCMEAEFSSCKLQSPLVLSQARLAPIAQDRAGTRRLLRKKCDVA